MLEKHMHHHIIRLKEGCVWAQTNCLTVPLVIDVPIPSPKNEWSCIYVLGVSICWFDVVLAVSYILFFILFQTYPCLQYSLVISNRFNTREWNLLWQGIHCTIRITFPRKYSDQDRIMKRRSFQYQIWISPCCSLFAL